MPATDPPHALPFPDLDTAADVPYWLEALATRLHALLDLDASPPRALARRAGAQLIANNTPSFMQFSSEDYDTDTMVDLVTSATRITIKTAGTYRLTGAVSWGATAAGHRAVSIVHNGAAVKTVSGAAVPSGAIGTEQQVTHEATLAVGDWVELSVTQTSGSGLNAGGSLLARRIGA